MPEHPANGPRTDHPVNSLEDPQTPWTHIVQGKKRIFASAAEDKTEYDDGLEDTTNAENGLLFNPWNVRQNYRGKEETP